MVSTALDHYARLDVLVSNAAIPLVGHLVDTTEEDWDQVQSVNLKGIPRLQIRYSREALERWFQLQLLPLFI